MTATKYKIKSGKDMWQVSFFATDAAGNKKRYHKRGFMTKREALAYEQQTLAEIAKQSDIYIKGLCAEYLEDGKARLKPTTYQNRVYYINNVVLPYFGEYRITEVTPTMIRKWQNSLINDPKGYSQTYLRSMCAKLSALFNFARRYHGLTINPVPLAGAIGKTRRAHFDFWTLEELKKFSATFLEESKFKHDHVHTIVDEFVYYVAFMLLFYSGMREGEMLALTVADVHPDTGIVDINKNYAVLHGGKEVFSEPKTPKSSRSIKVPQKVIALLVELQGKLTEPTPQSRLFAGLNKHGLALSLKTHVKLADVKVIRIHDLRHSHASLLVAQGVDYMKIQERLGHEKMQTTLDVYSHLYPERKDSVATLLDTIIED